MAYIEQGLRRMTYGGAVGNGVGSVCVEWIARRLAGAINPRSAAA